MCVYMGALVSRSWESIKPSMIVLRKNDRTIGSSRTSNESLSRRFWRLFGGSSPRRFSALMAMDNSRNLPPRPPDHHENSDAAFVKAVESHPTSGPMSYARAVTGPSSSSTQAQRPSYKPRFPPLSFPARHVGSKEGRPTISFTGVEVGACVKQFEFSLVAKFTVGRPSVPNPDCAHASLEYRGACYGKRDMGFSTHSYHPRL